MCDNPVVPKIVDHDARRLAIAEAVWRVVRREGLDAASVRAVAAEAGLSSGAMRHYFADHRALKLGAMAAIADRVGNRIAVATRTPGSVRERAALMLHEVLPLDAERRAETEVWLAFITDARVDETFRALADEQYDALRGLMGSIVDGLLPAEPESARQVEAERLFALVDGLALHAVQRPGALTPEVMRAAIDRHLDGLTAVRNRLGPRLVAHERRHVSASLGPGSPARVVHLDVAALEARLDVVPVQTDAVQPPPGEPAITVAGHRDERAVGLEPAQNLACSFAGHVLAVRDDVVRAILTWPETARCTAGVSQRGRARDGTERCSHRDRSEHRGRPVPDQRRFPRCTMNKVTATTTTGTPTTTSSTGPI